jgi:hypothetical protein
MVALVQGVVVLWHESHAAVVGIWPPGLPVAVVPL